jgi:3-phosphoshikimate 1-carboxyvinyltransferase
MMPFLPLAASRAASGKSFPMIPFPDRLSISPLDRPVNAAVQVPGSKSITNRALVLSALGGLRTCCLRGALRSEDTELMVDALRVLGFEIDCLWDQAIPEVWVNHPERVRLPAEAKLIAGNSGTTMRFLTALVSLGSGKYLLDGTARMRERPIQDLLDALSQLGVSARSVDNNGCPPVTITTAGLRGGYVQVRGDRSSQFLSALLLVAPFASSEMTITIDGPLVSAPYIDMTVDLLRQESFEIINETGSYRIPAPQPRHNIGRLDIEPDASAASYFFAAAAITGGKVTVRGLPRKSLQGDVRFVDVLEQMGCRVQRGEDDITVEGGRLHGVKVDMNEISDTVMTLAVVACFAEGPTIIRNVAHIRHKETDRLSALATELRRVGMNVDELADGLAIDPAPLHAAEIETYNDHRMAMSFALAGLRVPGIVITYPSCVAKTYPGFFTDLEKLR